MVCGRVFIGRFVSMFIDEEEAGGRKGLPRTVNDSSTHGDFGELIHFLK